MDAIKIKRLTFDPNFESLGARGGLRRPRERRCSVCKMFGCSKNKRGHAKEDK